MGVLGIEHSKVWGSCPIGTNFAVKRLDRLAQTLVHVCGFIWEWTEAKYKSPHNTQGRIGGGGV